MVTNRKQHKGMPAVVVAQNPRTVVLMVFPESGRVNALSHLLFVGQREGQYIAELCRQFARDFPVCIRCQPWRLIKRRLHGFSGAGVVLGEEALNVAIGKETSQLSRL